MKIISIILNYNDSKRAIELAKKNALLDIIYKVIIVDNCSLGDDYSNFNFLNNDKIVVIRTDHNGGFSYGNNFGFSYAYSNFDFDYIFISNTDTIYDEKLLLDCCKCISENPKIGLVSTRIYGMDGIEQNSFWNFATYKDFIKSCFFLLRRKRNKENSVLKSYKSDIISVDVVRASFMFFNKEALVLSGFFDDNVFLYGEETIICKRIKKHGYLVCLLTNNKYLHNHISRSVNRKNKIRLANIQLDSSYYIQKNYNYISRFKLIIAKMCLFWGKIENFIFITIGSIFRK